MISNYEFIKTQSFEVAWAIFRCADLFTQDDLRKKIEASAVDLMAGYDLLEADAQEEFPRIERVVSLVRLAESVGQIAGINANVLYRELDNLTKAIRLEIANRREKREGKGALDAIFTNSAYANNLQSTTTDRRQNMEPVSSPVIPAPVRNDVVTSGGEAGIQHPKDAGVNNSAGKFGSIESLLSVAVQSGDATAKMGSSAGNAFDSYIKPSTPSPATIAKTTTQNTATLSSANSSVGSWQNVILQKVKELNQTTTKELTASFPEISERTIRFYLQKLVDNGLIDRIGSTGPGSAYRAK